MKEKLRMLFDEKLWKFLLVGVLNTLVGNGLMFLLYNLAGFSYWPATGLSYALASVMSYFLNRYFTFKYQGSGWGTALRFALNIAVCYGLAYGLAKPLVRLIFSGLSKKWAENLAMLAGDFIPAVCYNLRILFQEVVACCAGSCIRLSRRKTAFRLPSRA